MATSNLKTNYAVEKRFEAFFTGIVAGTNRNGTWLFTICGNVINILDVRSGAQIAVIGSPQSEDDITHFTLRPTDDSVVVAYKNLLLKHYSIDKSKREKTDDTDDSSVKLHVRMVRTWRSNHRGPIIRMEFSADGRLLATGGSDGLVKIWDLELQYCVFTLRGVTGVITGVHFDALSDEKTASNRIFYGGDDGKVLCWDLKENVLKSSLELHSSAVTSIANDRDHVFTASRDCVIGVWDRQSLVLKKTLPVFESVESLVAMANSDGRTVLISAGDKGTVRMWDPVNGKCLMSSSPFGSAVKRIFLSRIDQKSYLSAISEDHVIHFLNSSDLSIWKHFVGYNDEILDASFLHDHFVAVASNSKDIRIYNLSTGDCRLVPGHSDIVVSVDSPAWDRNLFASGSKDNCLRIWKMTDDSVKCIASATGHTNNVTCVRFSRKSPSFVVSVSEDTTLKVWKLPAASRISSIGDDSNPEKLTSACTVAGHEKDVTCVDVSPNDKLLASGSMDKTVKIWYLNQKTLNVSLAGTITGHRRGIWDVCFSPVLQVIATASGDWMVKIFSLDDFSCVTTLEGHQTTVVRTRFLHNGLQILSTDSSGLVKLWNIKNGECSKTFDEHNKTVWALELNENGSKMLTGGGDSKLQLWKDITEEERDQEHQKYALTVADEQKLANLMDQKKFGKALKLAIRLSRPYNAFKIIRQMLQQDDEEELDGALRSITFDNIGILLDWICEWNTNAKNCHLAQKVLMIILKQYSPEKLLQLPNMKTVMEALIPYNERHFERWSRLRQQAAFVQYSWQCLRLTGRSDDGGIDTAIKVEMLRE